jgi:hypothetical protein
MRSAGKMKASMNARKARKARSGKTSVVVIEEAGELTAIVIDKARGVVRIPLGTVDPPLSAYS